MHSKISIGYAQILAGQDYVEQINWPSWFIGGDDIPKRRRLVQTKQN
jgi:hypothetical protein